ncbi:MAG: pyridoxal-phosphate dependent enzyme [Bacteroidetes bacterium]|nr:pyridoxal-phosphate dependent enzyme [Bacteroidota bacterium]
MKNYGNILDTIGKTPLVRLNNIVKGIKAEVYAKVEFFNPGNSVKDRIALKMIEDAERTGKLKPGGTIVECTSGNTGMGLALVSVLKGYKCIFTINDKQSKEKIDAMRAFGAEVIVCPTNVDADDPRSYTSTAKRLAQEIPNCILFNQYDNLLNSTAHYETTGPEIWEQTGGRVSHFVAGIGTGGTLCGTAKFLKEKNPAIKIWGIDPYGSVLKKYKETGIFDKNEIYPYLVEGVGEDFLPQNVNFNIIDYIEQVRDRDSAIFTRELVKKEGIWAGFSAGMAMAGVLQLSNKFKAGEVVVVIFPDHGSRYLAKIFNDEWMRDRGFLEKPRLTAAVIIESHGRRELISVDVNDKIEKALHIITESDISQMPVMNNGNVVGSISETGIYSGIIKDPSLKTDRIEKIMEKPFAVLTPGATLEEISVQIGKDNGAVLVKDSSGAFHIITKFDIIEAMLK